MKLKYLIKVIWLFDLIKKNTYYLSNKEEFYARRYAKKCVKYLRKYRECHKCHKDTLFYDFEEILEEVIKISSNDEIWKNKAIIPNRLEEISFINLSIQRLLTIIKRKL